MKERVTAEQFGWCWSHDAAERVFGRTDLVYPYAADVVNALAIDNEVHFVTHRSPERAGAITASWLAAHFTRYTSVMVLDNQVEKSSLGAWDVFIDDKPGTIAEFKARGLRIVAPTRPWNTDVECERFSSWAEVPSLL